ncbi:SDR family oxidoreductase [Nonomuraea sp. CA-218870]|uniref:SDR family oxidoreductase n=1 Tax=Nonomuraea sp. CA-218870 TaxID=3239998 RepID=UPI003D909AE2
MGRSVLVTGGARGIGLAVARELAAAGDAVTVTHRGGDPPGDLTAVPCDVTREDDVRAAFLRVARTQGPVEVLVANAGVTRHGPLALTGDDSAGVVADTNLGGVIRVARYAVRGMMRMRRGRIVLMSSAAAWRGMAGQAVYAATKAGLVGFGRSLAREVAPLGVTVNIVAPGFIDAGMTAAMPAAQRDEALAAVPLGRYGTAEEVAKVVRFLAGEDASYLTGAVIPVDGGFGMGH